MTAAVLIKNTLPAEIAAIAPEVMAKADALCVQAKSLPITDPATLAVAEDVYRVLVALGKQITAERLDITRPIDELKDQIIAAERKATVPLQEAKGALEKRIAAFRAEEQKRRDEAARKAREEAERAAAAEQKRLEEEQRQRIKEAEEKRAAAQAAADEEARLFGTKAEPVDLPAVPVAQPIKVIPVVDATVIPAELPKSAVRQTIKKVLVIRDASKIPRSLAGVELLVPNEKAIDKLMRAGVAVDGCELVDEQRLGSAGAR